MNEPIFAPLLFVSLSFLDSFFPSGLLLRKNPSARLGMLSFHSMLPLKFQGTWMVPSSYISLSPETDIWKKNSNRILIFCISSWNMFEYRFQSMQRRISCNTFFLRSIRTFCSSIWSSTVEVPFIFIDLCRFSRVDVPSSGPENVPKPRLPPYESPLSAVSSTCKEITWDKCYGSVRLALFTASLTKKCVVWNCALSKWMQMAMSWQWDKCHKIDMNSSKKQLLYIWSLVGPTPEGTPSMHSSWEHRGACAGRRSVESHLFMEGGFVVCEWQVAMKAHQAPNMLQLIAE